MYAKSTKDVTKQISIEDLDSKLDKLLESEDIKTDNDEEGGPLNMDEINKLIKENKDDLILDNNIDLITKDIDLKHEPVSMPDPATQELH